MKSNVTLESYKSAYEAHIKPRFGHMPINLITAVDISRWVDDMVSGKIANTRTGKPLSPKTIRDRNALMTQVMTWAANKSRRIIEINPCVDKPELPKRIRGMGKAMQPAEWQTLRQALIDLGSTDAADLAEFLLGSGWRIGEAMALNVAGVEDYGPGRPMWVTMNRVARRGRGETYIVEAEGKSQRAIRRIQLDPDTAAVVRRNAEGKRHNDLVFTKNGEPWHHHGFRDKLDKACAHAGLRHVSAHWFRHTHVTWMALSGANLPELQKRVEHASIQTTIDVYGSMIGDVNESVLSGFATMRGTSVPEITKSVNGDVLSGTVVTATDRLIA